MKVKELIEELKEFDENLEVFFYSDSNRSLVNVSSLYESENRGNKFIEIHHMCHTINEVFK